MDLPGKPLRAYLCIMKIRLLIQEIPLTLIRGYRYLLSPLFPPSCRFTPTCSQYAIEAIKTRGTVRGILLALGRILRCHPFCQGGYDPVPRPCCKADDTKCGTSASSKCSTQTLNS